MSIDAVVCHFFLLWMKQPEQALAEMHRVTRHGGCVVALAEPDYGGRIDYPDQFMELGRLQGTALQAQGADINAGRKLAALFHHAGFKNVQAGLLGGFWKEPPIKRSLAVRMDDAGCRFERNPIYKRIGKSSKPGCGCLAKWQKILFVPTFFAWGWV